MPPPRCWETAGPEQTGEYASAGVAEPNASPGGSVSVNPMADWAGLPAPFASVKVSVELPPTATWLGEKLLLIVGGLGVRQPPIVTLST